MNFRIKNKILQFIFLFVCLIILDIATLLNISLFGLFDLFWMLFLIPVTGGLILSIKLRQNSLNYLEWIIYACGIAISFLVLLGLLLDGIGLIFGLRTLDKDTILASYNIIFISLCCYSLKSNKIPSLLPSLHFRSLKKMNILRIVTSCMLPIVSVLGSVQLNNGGSDFFALANIVLIFLYCLALLRFRKTIVEQEYFLGIFNIGLALALSVSMRSNYLIGFDIHQEYQVFSQTLSRNLWYPHALSGAYNACLSITILPTVFKNLMPISAMYVFKFIMQLQFAIMPVIVYVIARKRTTTPYFAFIAALFFIVQGQYIFEFPALLRQGVAFIFFGLIFASAISTEIDDRIKSFLLIIFGISMVASHYSTTYISIAFLFLVLILRDAFRLLPNLRNYPKQQKINGMNLFISPVIIVILLLTTFLWYGETLQSTGGILQKISTSFTDFSSIFDSSSHSEYVESLLGKSSQITPVVLNSMEKSQSVSGGYRPTSSQYLMEPGVVSGIVATNQFQSYLLELEHKIIPLFASFLLAAGLIALLIESCRGRLSIDEGAVLASGACLFCLLFILPNLSQDYNIERLYQQLLIVLAPGYVYVFELILSHRNFKRMISTAMTVVTLLYLIGTSGILDQIIFKISNVNLVNNGSYYDEFYTNSGEIYALNWLEENYSGHSINLDRYSVLDAEAYTNLPDNKLNQSLIPNSVKQNSYVYASTTNAHDGISFGVYQGKSIVYNFPEVFYETNKNTVYINQSSEIYR